MNKFSQNLMLVALVTLAVYSLGAMPATAKSLQKRSTIDDDSLYHEKNICIMACGTCAEDDLNNLSDQVSTLFPEENTFFQRKTQFVRVFLRIWTLRRA